MAARAFIAAAAALGAAVLLSGDAPAAAVVVAFAGGTVVERWRQGMRARPLTLRATPQAWRAAIDRVDRPRAFAAALLAGAAVALPALPALHLGASPSNAGAPRTPAPLAFPAMKLRREPFGRSFVVDGISFKVFRPGHVLWAQTIRRTRLARHWRWVVVGVDVGNESGRRFNPSRLRWRLDDSAGHVWAATYGGGTGDAGLARRGVLAHGDSAQMRLGFAVPRRSHRLGLVWEAVAGGRPLRVALRRRG